ncbi:acyl-CoA dehydrogenase [Pedobacter frigidisoli]|uniref:Acyl-CoA dehydrogenase n=1 Tax=Pedobacter frigidisoli TaxID=2530455 RepID=A0A4R0NZI8_9SPHI|nr:acyl-CoA dehydrogenase family protein [Pedobacter frigidisoli]TCD07595.1 acyl-CoA dehydrogenase [Pedobacter frigidisoli]
MMTQDNSINPATEFIQHHFEEVLDRIAKRASSTENDPLGPKTEFEWLRSCGALQLVLPGGLLDFNTPNMPALLKLLKDIGKANLSVGRIFEGHINTLYLIHLYADVAQQEEWYKGVREYGHLFGIWNTQDKNGITLIPEKNGFIVNGCKTFCSGATLVNRALITGDISSADREGWQMVILNMDSLADDRIDRESWKPLGMKASGSYKVDFSGYQLRGEEFLGCPGIYLNQPYFNGGAMRFSAVQLGGAEAIAEATIAYLDELCRMGDPFQQLRLANMMSAVVSGRLWLEKAGQYYDSWADGGEHNEELIAFANMTRVNIEEICLKVMDDANRSVGARGLMEPYSLGRIFRDLSFYLRQPAPDATRLKVGEFFTKYPAAFDEHI